MAIYSFYVPHPRVQLDCGSELITEQWHKSECDINTILKQYQKTGIIAHINKSHGEYADLPDQMDFQAALALVQEASSAFSTLPSVVRDRFNNSPASFLLALRDPSQRAYLEEVGVFKRPPGAQPAANQPPPAAEA